jgi:hypothetical protein
MKRTLALPFALSLIALAASGYAQEDELEVVETRSQMEIVLIDADFVRPEDPSTSIFGGTTQFLDSEPILIELVLNEPISSEQLTAMKEADPDGATHFLCDQATLYLANDTHVGLGEGCSPTNGSEDDAQ